MHPCAQDARSLFSKNTQPSVDCRFTRHVFAVPLAWSLSQAVMAEGSMTPWWYVCSVKKTRLRSAPGARCPSWVSIWMWRMRSFILSVLNVQIVQNLFLIPISRGEEIFCASAARIRELLSVDVAASPFGENLFWSRGCHSTKNVFASLTKWAANMSVMRWQPTSICSTQNSKGLVSGFFSWYSLREIQRFAVGLFLVYMCRLAAKFTLYLGCVFIYLLTFRKSLCHYRWLDELFANNDFCIIRYFVQGYH